MSQSLFAILRNGEICIHSTRADRFPYESYVTRIVFDEKQTEHCIRLILE
jgi:hypothetical protein